MPRPDYQLAELTATEFDARWSSNNSVGGDFISKPQFEVIEDPSTGTSSRRLPNDARTTPYVYVYDDSSVTPEFDTVHWQTKKHTGSVRMEVVVADDMNGKTDKQMRDDIREVLLNIVDANNSPVDGVFGTDWQTLRTVNIDTNPSQFSNQSSLYFDIEYDADSLKL